MQPGFQNEIDFTKYFNHKQIKDLPINTQKFLYYLYNDMINDYSKIECWRSKYLEKSDIKLRINGIIKGISIKTGHSCSMHQENKVQFYQHLISIGIEEPIIKKLDNFLLGLHNGQKVNSKTYIKYHSNDISQINERINRYYIKINLLMRFITRGTEKQIYDCNALIHGTPDNFLWATSDEILQYLLNTDVTTKDYINIGKLNLKCYDRNLQNISSRKSKENDIQIKWLTIEEDMLAIKLKREQKTALNIASKNEF